MAKNPVFPLYYNDILGSCRTWTDEEFGAYMRLLIEQWDKGGLPNDYQRLTRIATSLDTNWPMLKEKFEEQDGLLKNGNLEVIRTKYLKHRAKQKENIEKRYQTSTTDASKKLPLEEEKENVIVLKELGSEKVNEAANAAWKDQAWRDNLCMGVGVSVGQLKRWMAMFNASLCNDHIADFNTSKYKKLIRGWISKQQSKGVVVEMDTNKISNSAPLTILKAE